MFKKKKVLAKDKRVRRNGDTKETVQTPETTTTEEIKLELPIIESVLPLENSPKWSSGFRSNRRVHSIPIKLKNQECTSEALQDPSTIIAPQDAILTGEAAFFEADTAMDGLSYDDVTNGLPAGDDALNQEKVPINVDEYGLPVEENVDSEMFDNAIDVGDNLENLEEYLEHEQGYRVFKLPTILTVEEQKKTLRDHVRRLAEEKLEKQAILDNLLLQLHLKKAYVAQLLEDFQSKAMV